VARFAPPPLRGPSSDDFSRDQKKGVRYLLSPPHGKRSELDLPRLWRSLQSSGPLLLGCRCPVSFLYLVIKRLLDAASFNWRSGSFKYSSLSRPGLSNPPLFLVTFADFCGFLSFFRSGPVENFREADLGSSSFKLPFLRRPSHDRGPHTLLPSKLPE